MHITAQLWLSILLITLNIHAADAPNENIETQPWATSIFFHLPLELQYKISEYVLDGAIKTRLKDLFVVQTEAQLSGHTDWVRSVACNTQKNLIASGGRDKTIRIWDSLTGELLHTLQAHNICVKSVAFNSEGTLLVSGGYDHKVRIWNPISGELLHTLGGHKYPVNDVSFGPDNMIISASDDNTTRVWDTTSGQLLHTFKENKSVNSATFNPEGTLAASAGYDRISIWDVTTKELIYDVKNLKTEIYSIAFNHDGTCIAAGGSNAFLQIWNIHTGQHIRALHGHTDTVTSVEFNSTGEQVASASYDRMVLVWDAIKGTLLHILDGHKNSVFCVAFDTENRLISGGKDKILRRWNPLSYEQHLSRINLMQALWMRHEYCMMTGCRTLNNVISPEEKRTQIQNKLSLRESIAPEIIKCLDRLGMSYSQECLNLVRINKL